MEDQPRRTSREADAIEKAEVRELLDSLTPDHVARAAFQRGANTLLIASMVEDPDISQRLRRVYLDGFERSLEAAKKGL